MAEEIFGEFGIATLDYDQLDQVIDVKGADKLSKKYGVDKLTAAQMGGLECGKCHY